MNPRRTTHHYYDDCQPPHLPVPTCRGPLAASIRIRNYWHRTYCLVARHGTWNQAGYADVFPWCTCHHILGYCCPKCGSVSYNSHDLRDGYCGTCHQQTGPPTAPNVTTSARARDAAKLVGMIDEALGEEACE